MSLLDWILLAVPMIVVIVCALRAQRYQRGVADFLSAGRVGGRYVMSVASEMAGMGLITVVAATEAYYRSGMSYAFWEMLYLPVGFVLGLTGFCTYRFRETRAMTMGQFFEMRFSRSFRITAAVIQSLSGIINYAIFPAVGARFLIYYLDLPTQIELAGWLLPTFQLVMAAFLSLALLIVLLGGQVTVLVTDCVQGLFSYPMYLLILGFILWKFDWSGQVMPVLGAEDPGRSLLNPFEIENLRDFNAFYVFVGITGMFLGRLSWGGTQGFNSSARSAHEARMGNLLGTWRAQFYKWMSVILAVAAIVYLNSRDYADEAREVRAELANRVAEDVAPDHAAHLREQFAAIEPRSTFSPRYDNHDAWRAENEDPFLRTAKQTLSVPVAGSDGSTNDALLTDEGRSFSTIYSQMTVSVALKHMLPTGLIGIFCALMIFLLVSTDTSYLHSWGSILVQDFVLPLCRKPLTPKQQLRALRLAIAGVAAFAFIFSSTFAQIDFILMFFAITGAFWAGAGAVITLGLYWSRGTTQGAFAALIAGALIALSGFAAQKCWPEIYGLLAEHGLVESVGAFLDAVTSWCSPYIVWKMNPEKFPINSQEILFITNAVSLLVFILVSLKTCRRPFNMDRLLHRGAWRTEGEETSRPAPIRRFGSYLREHVLGINDDYSKGDRIIAWAAFLWSFGYVFLLCFCAVVIWNIIAPWPESWWGHYFYITIFIGTAALGLVFSVWFTWGGIRDLRALFRDLRNRPDRSELDNGSVIGNVSAADSRRFSQIEQPSESPDKD
ncbi:MAG TPA: hypothetical protein H9862_00720 [Candidatus Akkermansia intestinigallinarum]|uniref:Sodium:solute symporter family protein n=1 Tax=Candidatus Akkermansia intestinigallinarum TaxID=2838431 RepID=A0A9D1V9X3_9BACT|nr:hypothetical protein [Candidatus Akkermansia intestinigallinarum]